MVRVWQQTENNRMAEDLAILQRDIGAVKDAKMSPTLEFNDTPSPTCPGFCVDEIRLALQVITAFQIGAAFDLRLGEAIMARMRLEEELTNAVG